jgi:hypothetical protein
MNKRRFLAIWLATATVAVIATSVALAYPTSSHSGGANADQIGVVRIDPSDPSVAYVTGRRQAGLGPQGGGQQRAYLPGRRLAVSPPRPDRVHLRRHLAHRHLADLFARAVPGQLRSAWFPRSRHCLRAVLLGQPRRLVARL